MAAAGLQGVGDWVGRTGVVRAQPVPTSLARQEGSRGESVEAVGMEFEVRRFRSLPDALQEHPGIRRDLRGEGLLEGFQKRGPASELGLGCKARHPSSGVVRTSPSDRRSVVIWGAIESTDLCASSSCVSSILRSLAHSRCSINAC